MDAIKRVMGVNPEPVKPKLTPEQNVRQLNENIAILEKQIKAQQKRQHEMKMKGRNAKSTSSKQHYANLVRQSTLTIQNKESTIARLHGLKQGIEDMQSHAQTVQIIQQTTQQMRDIQMPSIDQIEVISEEANTMLDRAKEMTDVVSKVFNTDCLEDVPEDELDALFEDSDPEDEDIGLDDDVGIEERPSHSIRLLPSTPIHTSIPENNAPISNVVFASAPSFKPVDPEAKPVAKKNPMRALPMVS